MTFGPGSWAVIQTVGRQGASFLIFLVLSRLLSPKDFGLLGMAISWIGFVSAFSELGFSAAIIQRKEIEEKHLSTTFFVNVALGLMLTIIGIGMSIPAATFFKTPEVRPVIALLSLSFIVNSLTLTQMAIAQRELKFKKLAIRDLSASIIGGIIGIFAAFWGYGVWSLVVQMLITGIVSTVLLWQFSKWRPSFRFTSLECVKELWPYSSKIFYFNLFKYFAQNTDKLLIGYFLGSVALGLYTFTFKIVIFPITTFVGAVGSYLFPKYSRIQEDISDIKSSYLEINGLLGATVAPVLFLIIILSTFLVPLLFGEKWNAALPLFPIMAIVAFLQTIISPVGNLLKATNRPGWMLNWSVFITILAALLMVIGVEFGIEGVALGLAGAYLIGSAVNMWILNKVISLNYSDIINVYVNKLIPILIVAGIIFFSVIKKKVVLASDVFALLTSITVVYSLVFYKFNRVEVSLLFMKLRKSKGL